MFWNTCNCEERVKKMEQRIATIHSFYANVVSLEEKVKNLQDSLLFFDDRLKLLEKECISTHEANKVVTKISNEQLYNAMELDDLKGALTNISSRLLLLEPVAKEIEKEISHDQTNN